MKQGVFKHNRFFSSFAVTAFIVGASFSQAVHANFVSFDFTFSGADFNNTAQMTGTITFDDALLTSGGLLNTYSIGDPRILDLDVTVAGASSGNGHFTMSDFSFISFSANGGVLDPNSQLIGQSTSGLPWGTPSNNYGEAGDFNLFGLNSAPYGTWFFQERTAGGSGDLMQLTSMTPTATSSAAPIESWTDSTADLTIGTGGFFGRVVSLKANQSLAEHNLSIESNGYFSQQGGVHTVSGNLANNGNYFLFGGSLSAANETIGDNSQPNYGYGPSGNFTQNGGTNIVNGTLTLGKQTGTQGTYNLLSGALIAQQQIIGDAGNGTFNQSGGTNTVSGSLVLGQQAGGRGIYNLSGGLLTALNEIVGDGGEGTFNQGNYGYGASNPVNNVNGTLTLGKQAGGIGTYNLAAGTLSSQQQIIGDAGKGTFNQSGGTNTVSGSLVLGQQAGSHGEYNLTGGVLVAFNEIVGGSGNGVFTQGNNYGYGASDSTNSVNGTLTLGKDANGTGTYNLLSGTLSAQQQIVGDAGKGTFNQSGGTNAVTGSLVLGQQAGSHGTYNLSNGVLTAFNEVVGDAGEGTFTQGQNNYGYGSSNPSNNVNGTLTLGKQKDGVGTYNLLSGSLNAQQQIIGGAGSGTFNQSGGSNAVSGSLVLGQQAGSHGLYNLLDGALIAMNEVIGDGGEGKFTQGNNYGYGSTNPTNTVTDTLTLGKQVGSHGAYNLISGVLSSVRQIIGDAGSGAFSQSGGSNTVTGTLTLGKQAGSSGSYSLQGGELHSSTVVIGDAGIGNFSQSGGTHSTTNLILGQQSSGFGTYLLSGGNLNVHGNIEHGAGTSYFLVSGGVLNFDAGKHEVAVDKFETSGAGIVNLADNTITTFQGHVIHNGQAIHIGAGGNAIFNGEFEGAGAVTGTGTVTFNNLLKVGEFLPTTFTVEGDMVLGHSSTTSLKVAGPDRGVFYDAVDVGGNLTLGGELQLLSPFGYVAHLGDTFDLFEADHISGHFDLLNAFALGGGLAWKIDYLTDAIGNTDVVRLSIVNAVPLPAAFWLLQVPLFGLVATSRMRKRVH